MTTHPAIKALEREVKIQIRKAELYRSGGYRSTAHSYLEWSLALEHAIKVIRPYLESED
jgi:hypothetical protein